MEKYIDLINAYLNKTLSEVEVSAFENRLKTDVELNSVYNEHLTILRGIERVELLEEIDNARKYYTRNKWLKYVGLAIVGISILILTYNLISNSQHSQTENTSGNDTIEVFTDSISTQKRNDTIKKYVTIKYNIKTVKDEELTKLYGGVEILRDTLILDNIGLFTKEDFESKFPEIKDFKIENDTIFMNPSFIEVKEKPKNESKKQEVSKTLKTQTSSVKSFYNSIEKEVQVRSFDAQKDVELKFKEGTIISIPANAFIDSKTQKEVTGTIEFEVTEYYKLSDILLADLSTKSDTKILETGGMLYIEALKNGSKLKLKPQKDVKIIFNNSGKKSMQLFKGERTDDVNINWKLDDEIEAEYVIDELTGRIETEEESAIGFVDENTNQWVGEEVTIAYQFIEQAPEYPDCNTGSKEDKYDCMRKAINKFINKKLNLPSSVILTPRKYKIQTTFEIDEEGNIGKIEVRASRRELAEEITRLLELLPRLKPGYYKERPVRVKYALPITYEVEGSRINGTDLVDITGKRDSIITVRSDKKFQKEIEAKSISDISNSELERYTFSTSNLGWINCDRFVRSKKRKIKYKLKIKDAEGANIKLIFKSISSVLPSYESNNQYNFGDVPVNEDVILLGIKKVDDKLYLGIKEVKTKVVSELDINFKAVTIAELKTELNKLNRECWNERN